VPKSFPQDALSKYGWIQHHTGKSITALEIIYGVLHDPRMKMQSFFYFRDPSFIADVPEPFRGEMEAESPESARKLAELKQAIRAASLPVPPMEHYPCRYAGLRVIWQLARAELGAADRRALEQAAKDGIVDPAEWSSLERQNREIVKRYGVVHLGGLEQFAHRVLDDLWAGICRQFPDLIPETKEVAVEKPPEEPAEWLAEEEDYHEAFIESRTRVYVGRKDIHSGLLNYVASEDLVPLVVSGASGSGKSAILGRLYNELQDGQDGLFLLAHFVGASPRSTDLRSVLRRFCLALRLRFGLTRLEVPEEVEKLADAFRQFVQAVPPGERALLIVDALNQLDERHQAHTMHWLPLQLPSNVKVVLSCLEGERRGDAILAVLRQRGCRELRVGPLTPQERFEIVTQVPSLSAKTLDPQQVGLLLSNPATTNPLFLLVALEELRGFGSFEQLNARINAFPREGDTVTAIFDQVLERLGEEFNAHVVREALSLMAVSRHGLTERELKALLREADARGDLLVLLRQLRPYLLKRGELVDFYHNNLKQAVRQRYLPRDDAEREAHLKMARYFSTAAKSQPEPEPRSLTELPHHLSASAQTEELAHVLTDIQYLDDRCRLCDIYGLVEDYRLIPTDRHAAVEPYQEFIRRHAQRLSEYRALLFTLMCHEGFPAARSQALALARRGDWHKPWLRTAQAWAPPSSDTGTPAEQVEILAQSAYAGSCATDLAPDRLLAFCVRRLGQVGAVDLHTGQELPYVVSIRSLPPLTLSCSPNGHHLAVAYDNGEVDLLRLDYDQQGALLGQEPPQTFGYRMPEYEAPVLAFLGDSLWYQAASGAIARVGPGPEPPAELSTTLTIDLQKAELSGVASAGDVVVLTMRVGADTYVVTVQGDVTHEVLHRLHGDVSALCECGQGRVAIAFTNGALEVFDPKTGLSQSCKTALAEPPMCIAASADQLLWSGESGRMYAWTIGSPAGPRALMGNSVEPGQTRGAFLRWKRLALISDGTYAAVGPAAAGRFAVRTGGVRSSVEVLAAFEGAEQEGYYAFEKRPNGLWLLNGVSQSVLWVEEGLSSHYAFGIDGKSHLLAARVIGQAALIDPDTRDCGLVANTPEAVTSVAGDPQGGFWLVVQTGDMYFVGDDRKCIPVLKSRLEVVGSSEVRCWTGLVLWTGACILDLPEGRSMVFVASFYRPDTHYSRKLHMLGTRVFGGLLQAVAYDVNGNRVLFFWQGGRVKSGTPQQFIDRAEEEKSIRGTAPDVVEAKITPDGTGLYLLSRRGNLFRLDGQTLQLQSVLAGSAPLTGMGQGACPDDGRLLVVEGRSKLIWCRFEEGKRDGFRRDDRPCGDRR
jgi:hypothetical protein